MLQKISITLFILFYGIAGINHFINPGIYELVIPKWLGDAGLLNVLAGIAEISVAFLAIFDKTRTWAGWLTIAMLIVFTISHIYFIQMESCAGNLCLEPWIGWARLLVIHPLLLYWAYRVGKS